MPDPCNDKRRRDSTLSRKRPQVQEASQRRVVGGKKESGIEDDVELAASGVEEVAPISRVCSNQHDDDATIIPLS
jgi:hypothetical protein